VSSQPKELELLVKSLSENLKKLREDFLSFKTDVTFQISELKTKSVSSQSISKSFSYANKEELILTYNSIEELHENLKRPVKLIEISEFMNLSKETTYNRCEKLVETDKIKKFYGRDLGLKPSKSAFYRPNVSLYDFNVIQSIDNSNERKIANIFIQRQEEEDELGDLKGIKISTILEETKLTKIEVQKALQELIIKGLIGIKRYPGKKEIYYRIIT
jgi:predicted transcriptional regulator